MASPPELAEIFITAAFRSIHSPRAAIRFGRLDSGFLPLRIPRSKAGKRRAANESKAGKRRAANGRRPAMRAPPSRLT